MKAVIFIIKTSASEEEMSEEKERRAKIISLFNDACTEQQAVQASKIRITGHKNATGHGNIVINGDVTVQSRPEPQPEFITTTQGFEIQQLIYKLADLDVSCGFSTGGVFSARKKWWYLLRNHFKTTSYKNIPYHQFDDVVTYLNHHKQKLQAELDKTITPAWRNRYYNTIYAKCNERDITKEQLYQMADHYLDVDIDSLKDLSDTDLKHLYNIIMS